MQTLKRLQIIYCPKCGWLLRAAWLAQEALSTFSEELDEVVLKPARESGRFEILLNEHSIWERNRDKGFPQAAEFKRILRDQLDPERDLGHVDHKAEE